MLTGSTPDRYGSTSESRATIGAVGIANVLLVSVRERRAEIGTRRAVGATRRAIFAGFLIEALVMTLSGGTLGIVFAWLLTKIALFIPQVPVGARPHISLVTALVALLLLTLVGLVAGVWPARRAAAVFPAEALRARRPRGSVAAPSAEGRLPSPPTVRPSTAA